MAGFESLIDSGRIVDLMLAFIALEIAVIVWYRRRTGRGIAWVPLVVNAGAGASLMLAVRAVATGGTTMVVALCLLSALGFHMADLALRWQR